MTKSLAPPHVAIILDNGVRLQGMTQDVYDALIRLGQTVTPTKYGALLPWETLDSDTPHVEDKPLVELLQLLAEVGVGFALDYKQMWPPAEVVAELIERGTEFKDPWACGFDGHVWHVKPYPWSNA